MILNYFNYIKNKRTSFFFIGLFALIAGCAPVRTSSQRTNPYENKRADVRNEADEIVLEETFEPELTPVQPEGLEKTWSRKNKNQRNQMSAERRTLSPAVLALVTEADNSSKSGDLGSAVVTIERALRIDSRNPFLTYKLAALRLQQSKPRLAENLARKSALLSGNNKLLKKQAWLLISEARKQQENYLGAKEAELKANKI